MNNAAELVLGTIRAQACGKQYPIKHDLAPDILKEAYALSKAHDVAHLVAAELNTQKALQDNEINELFRKQQILAVYRYERIGYELTEICRILDEAGVPYMPLKGAVMRRYYPEPWMRTSSDIDILVKPKDVAAATDALVGKLNYQNQGAYDHDVQMYAPSGVHLELHFETIEEHYLANANEVLKSIWDEHAWCISGQQYAMSNEMFYFYHIAHMAKHFTEAGCGIRFFVDLWLLNHRLEYDHQKKTELLQAGQLLEFAQNAEHLSEVWFGEAVHTEITKRMEGYVLSGGIYGGVNNSIAVKSAKNGGRVGYAMYLVFRPYHELRRQYPVLYKYKWLYPFCQLHRWLCLIFNGGIVRAARLLKRGARVYEETGSGVDKMLRDLNLAKKTKSNR